MSNTPKQGDVLSSHFASLYIDDPCTVALQK